MPIGRGALGAMAFGKTELERIQLNEDPLWSGGPMDRVNPDSRAHLDEVRQLLELMEHMVPSGERVAREMYGARHARPGRCCGG